MKKVIRMTKEKRKISLNLLFFEVEITRNEFMFLCLEIVIGLFIRLWIPV